MRLSTGKSAALQGITPNTYAGFVLCVLPVQHRNAVLQGITHDIHADVAHDEGIMQMHDDAEKFDPRTEQV